MFVVFGGTGLVGSRVVETLLSEGNHVRLVSRGRGDWQDSKLPLFRRRGAEVVAGDMADPAVLRRTISGATCIINCAGILRAENDAERQSTNAYAVEELVRIAENLGVQRLIHLSCLGAVPDSASSYFRSKWQGENAVRKGRLYWTIFRPSIIFGPACNLHNILEYWVTKLPFLLLVGSGLNRAQPISADDVAACIISSIYNRDTVHKTIELVGPELYDFGSILAGFNEETGLSRRVVRIPTVVGCLLAQALGKLIPTCPIDAEVIRLLTSELVGDESEMQEFFRLERKHFRSSVKAIAKVE